LGSNGGSGDAIYGTTAATGGAVGVQGEATGTTGANVAVYGDAASTSGYAGQFAESAASGTTYGVYATDASASGYGIYATNSNTGYAGYFSGKVNVTGSVQVGSTTASCSGSNAGAVQYTSGTLEACNGTSWTPIDSGMHFISTASASTTTSIQFTSLPAPYTTLFMNCEDLALSNTTSGKVLVQVGESSGPTWEPPRTTTIMCKTGLTILVAPPPI
jgi:hypothetical protein